MTAPAKIGRYEILEELGHGAMGSVYKARDPLMDRTVAVKTILASALAGASAAEYRERFFREARAAGRFSHPGIVTVHDVGEHEGMPFLVMEYITGRTLAAAMEAGERFAFDRIFELGREIAEALGYAHAHGVIHRDIKPANIMLAAPLSGGLAASPRGPERAKVTDFGVAKLAAAQVTVTGQLLGTPSFMPPEQFTGAPIDGRSDLFSLGVILYWLATGDKPFTGDTITAVSYKIVHTEIVPPRKINPAIPRDFEIVVLKLLQKDPALRYATGEALAEDLAALRAGRPPAIAEATVISAPVAVARPPREHDPDATLDIDAPVFREATPRPRPAPPASAAGERRPAPHVSPVAQPRHPSSRWKNVLLAVLILAVVYLVGRLSGVGPGERTVQAPTIESSPAQQPPAGTEPKEPAQAAGTQPPQTQPDSQPSKEGNETAAGRLLAGPGKPSAAPAPPSPAQPVPGVPDMEKLQRDIDAYVRNAMQQAARSQQLSAANRKELLAKALEEKPVPAGQSRLIIDAARVPRSLSFAIEVDGKIAYTHKPSEAAGRRAEIPFYSVLLAPGEHSVRAHVGSANMRLGSSNLLTARFEAAGQRLLTIHTAGGMRRPRAGAPDEPNERIILRISIE